MTVPTLTAEAIIFSINSAIRLSGRFRKAYADSLKAKRISLPLPSFHHEPTETTIEFFFREEGNRFLGQIELLDQLHEKAKNSRLTIEELREYREFYRAFGRMVRRPNSDHFDKESMRQPIFLNREDVVHFFKIRQWELGMVKPTSILQLVAGSLVEIGIDYFTQVPGALNLKSAHGLALKNFLGALDEVTISSAPTFRELTNLIVPRLFASAAETISDLSTEITSDENLQKLIRATSLGITSDLYARIDTMTPATEREEIIHWGQMVIKSTIRSAGTHAFNNTRELFGTNDSAGKLVEMTGKTFLHAILESGGEDQIDFKEVFTAQTLDEVMKSAFTALSEYPGWLSRQEAVRNILSGVSNTLATSGIRRPGLAPELVRLMLEETAENIDLFWDEDINQGEGIMISALRDMLTVLAMEPEDGRWKPKMSNSQILDMVYGLTEDIVQNPAWATQKVDDQSLLKKVLLTTFGALAQVPAHDRFTPDTFSMLLQLNLRAVARSPRILSKIKWGNTEEETIILDKALDLVFSFTINENETPPIGRLNLLVDLTEFTLDTILRQNPDKKGLLLLDLLLFKDSGIDFSNGFTSHTGEQLLDSALNILDMHTELVTNDHVLKNIISDTAHAIRSTTVERQNLVPEIVRLIFEQSAGHLDFLMADRDNRSVNLLVLALKQTLLAISSAPEAGRWKPQFTNEQLLELIDIVSTEVITNPAWGRNEKLIFDLLQALFAAMENIPAEQKLPNALVNALVQKAFQATSSQKRLLLPLRNETGESTGQLAIQYSLENFFITLYSPDNAEVTTWEITNSEVIHSLMDYFVTAIASGPADRTSLDEVINNFKKTFGEYQQNTIVTVDELLATLAGMV